MHLNQYRSIRRGEKERAVRDIFGWRHEQRRFLRSAQPKDRIMIMDNVKSLGGELVPFPAH